MARFVHLRPTMKRFVTLLSLSASTLPLLAEIKLGDPFTDHMVLQRDIPIKVWGTSTPSSEITVSFAGQTVKASADDKGRWTVKFNPLKTNASPAELTASESPASEKSRVTLKDVLVGEVWVGSGQSNMQGTVGGYAKGDPVLAKLAEGTYPLIRLRTSSPGRSWEVAAPAAINNFSAILFGFGVPLQKHLGVPVGLTVGAVGGTPSGYWLSEEMYRTDAGCRDAAEKSRATFDLAKEQERFATAKAKYDAELEQWKPLADKAKAEGKQPPPAPRAPEPVVLPGESKGKIGNLYERFIQPMAGYGIRGVLWDQGESKTAIAGVDQFNVMNALIRGWRKAWDQGDFPFLYVQKPSGGGPAWDYTNPVTDKANKFSELPATVPPPDAGDYSYALHLSLIRIPNTHMVTSTDLGPGIHPSNKSGYGARAALVAQSTVYQSGEECLGPVYTSHRIDGSRFIVKFTHIGNGLAFQHGTKLQGFVIAGEDKKFVWADATIQGEEVVVSHPSIEKPEAVRYAYSAQFPWANLFNKNGLPAQPFRTDRW
jgi:sialate O-acetylesterase